jgi:hypothetical protein
MTVYGPILQYEGIDPYQELKPVIKQRRRSAHPIEGEKTSLTIGCHNTVPSRFVEMF